MKKLLILAALMAIPAAVPAQNRDRTPPPPTTWVPAGRASNGLLPVPVPEVDGMLRRMRVYLFRAPAGSSAFGVDSTGTNRVVWALLPSCRPPDPDDPRDPCPVDRLTFEAVGGGRVTAIDPQNLTPTANARRIQVYVVSPDVQHVHLRLMGQRGAQRYEAMMVAERLSELTLPQGQPTATGFEFELPQYPAR